MSKLVVTIKDQEDGEWIPGVGTVSRAPSKLKTVKIDLSGLSERELLTMIVRALGLDEE